MENQNEKITFDDEKCCYMGADSGEQYWPIDDVCEILEITDADQAMAELDPDQIVAGHFETDSSESQVQETTFIDHAGVLTLMMQSQAPISKKFRRWVAHEVMREVLSDMGEIYHIDMSIKKDLFDESLLPWWAFCNF